MSCDLVLWVDRQDWDHGLEGRELLVAEVKQLEGVAYRRLDRDILVLLHETDHRCLT